MGSTFSISPRMGRARLSKLYQAPLRCRRPMKMLWNTERVLTSPGSCGISADPRRRWLYSSASRVDLPAPLRPTRATRSPFSMRRETLLSTARPL